MGDGCAESLVSREAPSGGWGSGVPNQMGGGGIVSAVGLEIDVLERAVRFLRAGLFVPEMQAELL